MTMRQWCFTCLRYTTIGQSAQQHAVSYSLLSIAGIPRRPHRHRHPGEDPRPTHRHPRESPREEDGVGVGVVECGLIWCQYGVWCVIGPILWGHSGPLCHALSLSSSSSLLWTSMRRRWHLVNGNASCGGSQWRMGTTFFKCFLLYIVGTRFAANHSREVYAWAGSQRNITCRSLGVPTPSIDWMIGERVLRNNKTYQIFDQGATSHLQVTQRTVPHRHTANWMYFNGKSSKRNTKLRCLPQRDRATHPICRNFVTCGELTQSSCGGSVIRCVLPVLWVTTRLH